MTAATLYKRPAGAIHYADGPRYVGGFGVLSSDGSKVYKISFDKAGGYWMCSCTGCIMRGDCKHLAQHGRSEDSRRAMQELAARGKRLPPMPKFEPSPVGAVPFPVTKALAAAPLRAFARDEDI